MSIEFEIVESKVLPDVKILTPSVFEEARGNIWTSYLSKDVDLLVPGSLEFKHDKFSHSKFNVLRGIHGDNKSWKLVTCVFGEIHQVVVDMRQSSASYLKWQRFVINNQNRRSVLIPPGFGNAYYVSSDIAVYHYKLAYPGEYLDADEQFTVAWNDERLAIDWPTTSPLLSPRDERVSLADDHA